MKVLMLGWELPPHHIGGMGVACYQMCEELSYHGVDIEFILPFNADFSSVDFMKVTPAHHQSAEEFSKAGGVYDSEQFKKTSKLLPGGLDLQQQHDLFAHNVAKLAYHKEFDIIHAHDWLTFRAGIAAKQASGKPLVLHVHATQFDQSAGGHGNPLAREIEYQAFSIADQIFAVSNHTKNVIVREYGVDANKVEVVHNSMEIKEQNEEGMNAHRYLEVMKQHGYKVVANIGRITIQKGLTQLLETAAKVVSKNPKVLFFVAGRGEQLHELIEISAKYGLSRNVIFEPWVSGKRLRDSYRIADVFVMPSVSEPFGLTPLEAIGLGTPAIISKQSGVSEILNNCMKVDFWDTTMMADMILNVVENPDLANTMWWNSYAEYNSQSWADSARKMKQHYRQTAGVV